MDARNIGLRNNEVADTKICSIDGENGKLIYRGYDILDLVNHSTYEESAYMLLFGELPTTDQLKDFNRRLVEARGIPEPLIKNLRNRPKRAQPMDILQSCVSELADYDLNIEDASKEAHIRRAIILIAKIPAIVSAWNRIRSGHHVLDPLEKVSHAANFLYMLRGIEPSPEEAKVMDICLILHAEHSFNASTFAAREIASTRAHMYASIGGAIGALSGELHGGANVQVMKMLLEIGDPANADRWVANRLHSGGRIMGMGHAVYRTTDPRADILARLSSRICREKNNKWYEITRRIEEGTKKWMLENKHQGIYPNVDLYSASVYYSMGIPIDLNTPIFATSRISDQSETAEEEEAVKLFVFLSCTNPLAGYLLLLHCWQRYLFSVATLDHHIIRMKALVLLL